MMNRAATCQLRANASNGTAAIWMKYPNKVIGQNFWVFSLSLPETRRSPYPSNSPSPATMPTIVPLAPKTAMNGPVTLRAPSYVKSAKKLTTPMSSTNLSAAFLLDLRTLTRWNSFLIVS